MAATLRAVLYQAQVDELIPSNPAARFGKLFDARHDARQHVKVFDTQDVADVLKSAAKWYPDHELLVVLLFYTGMREGEVELPRFRGHPIVGAERSIHDAEEPSAVRARVPAADR